MDQGHISLLIGALIIVLAVAEIARRFTRAKQNSDAEFASLRSTNTELERQLAVATERSERASAVENKLEAQSQKLETAQGERAKLEADLAGEMARYRNSQETITDLRGRILSADGDREKLRGELASAHREKAQSESQVVEVKETLRLERLQWEEKIKLLTDARDQMTKEFKLLATAVMQEHGEAFSKQNKDQIEQILTPLRERLNEFQIGLSSAHNESTKERATLAEQIKQLSTTSASMLSEANNLTRALKGKVQTQGAWGEMILKTILERSGLREGEEYVAQQSQATEDGERLRPDVVVNLPGGQRIVIDAKVSLTAFEAFVNAESDEDRASCLKRHLSSVRSHIKTLSDKAYQVHTNGGVDYVIMFVPIEGALAVALQDSPDITGEAIEQNVNIATPSTLMIALRTAASVWQVENRNRNAEAIATRAGQLYDKFVGFTEEMKLLGKRLHQAQGSYDDALAKLTTGSGNLVRQVEQLKTLGARASKTLPAVLLDGPEAVVALSSPEAGAAPPG